MNTLAIRALVISTVLAAVAVGSYQFGRHVKTGEVAEQNLKTEREQQQQVQALQDKADLLATANVLIRAQKEPKERLITKEIATYVEVTPADQRCSLPGTWRVRHDAAATGIPLTAETGSLAVGADAEVEDAAALETVGDNYRTARDCGDKLDGWIRRYRQLELGESAP